MDANVCKYKYWVGNELSDTKIDAKWSVEKMDLGNSLLTQKCMRRKITNAIASKNGPQKFITHAKMYASDNYQRNYIRKIILLLILLTFFNAISNTHLCWKLLINILISNANMGQKI